jgi:extracellular factor (EF) 3-hydroxypalmitic acid methyl ester biosynthesis protein
VLNLGCGPAAEVEQFLTESVADYAELTLWDFNEETLEHTASVLGEARRRNGRHTVIQIQKKSAHQVLKEGQKPVVGTGRSYDFIYCAGLFDYLSDRTCRQLMNIFYDWLAPGGLLLATNVNDTMNARRPFRYSMEYLLDWHLIYRDGGRVAALAPERAPGDTVKISSEESGVNVFIEIRKPEDV